MEHQGQGQIDAIPGRFSYHHDHWGDLACGRPVRLYGQHFPSDLLEEDLPPLDTWAMMHPHSRRMSTQKESGISEINCTEDEFQVKLDVHQFRADELTAKIVDNYILVEGQHEDRADAHGFIARHFKRRYRLPDNVRDDQLVIDLSSDGILQIRVPRAVEGHHDPNMAKLIRIQQTGRPAVANGAMRKGSVPDGHHYHSLNG